MVSSRLSAITVAVMMVILSSICESAPRTQGEEQWQEEIVGTTWDDGRTRFRIAESSSSDSDQLHYEFQEFELKYWGEFVEREPVPLIEVAHMKRGGEIKHEIVWEYDDGDRGSLTLYVDGDELTLARERDGEMQTKKVKAVDDDVGEAIEEVREAMETTAGEAISADKYLCLTGLDGDKELKLGIMYFHRSTKDVDGTTSSELYLLSQKHSGSSVDSSDSEMYHSALKINCSDGVVETVALVNVPNRGFPNMGTLGTTRFGGALSEEAHSYWLEHRERFMTPVKVDYRRGGSVIENISGKLPLGGENITLPDFPKGLLANCGDSDFVLRLKGPEKLEYIATFDVTPVCLIHGRGSNQ